MDAALDRLNFYSSPEIAPLVRVCEITPWDRTGRSGWKFRARDEPYILLHDFYSRLPCFTNLHSVRASQLRLTQQALANLCLLPRLHHLSLTEGCRAVPGHILDLTLVRFETLTCFEYHEKPGAMEVESWFFLLPPAALSELDIRFNPENFGEQQCRKEIDLFPSFPSVQRLTITENAWIMDRTRLFLSKFPALRFFSIRHCLRRAYPSLLLPSPELPPLLEEFIGYHEDLHTFLPHPSVTRLTIHSSVPGFISVLQTIGSGNNLTSFSSLPSRNFELSSAQCSIHGYVNFILLFLEELPVCSLPPCLQKLALKLPYGLETELTIPPSDFVALQADFTEKHPRLNVLWLDVCGYPSSFVSRWRRNPKEQVIVEDHAGRNGNAARADFDSFWDEG
ncbi:hypothetical protein C8R43DRAFT_1235912 [Mycena crocata]|nr:hypothetical protein C8R43DRAFT_1235912 [Mycena crocata]